MWVKGYYADRYMNVAFLITSTHLIIMILLQNDLLVFKLSSHIYSCPVAN